MSGIRNKYLKEALKDVSKYRKLLRTKDEDFWIKRGEKMMRNLYNEMIEEVPAYKKFKEYGVNRFFRFPKTHPLTPLVDKDNYLRKNELKDLCWQGSLETMDGTISATSGSTGEPFYFPRSEEQDILYSLTAELYLLENFQADKKTTLYINAFAMGPWIGGVFTYSAIKHVQGRDNINISILTAGVNKKDTISAISKLGGNYDQIIIGCYPPSLKDILDEGKESGLNWSEYNINFVFSAEGFSEKYREHIFEVSGQENKNDFNYFKRSLNHYGTVDLGTMSYETPICVLLRKMALDNVDFYRELLRFEHKLPTLTQYIPEHFFFEEERSEGGYNIICSSYSGIPLYRYDLKDNGGIIKFGEVNRLCKKYFNKSIEVLARENGIEESLWKLPFVFVCERKDFSVKFYGFEIMPETIRNAVEDLDGFYENFSGKFTLESAYDNEMNQILNIHFEKSESMKGDIDEDVVDSLKNIILKNLKSEIIPYEILINNKGESVEPNMYIWENGNEKYFGSKGKQKWVRK